MVMIVPPGALSVAGLRQVRALHDASLAEPGKGRLAEEGAQDLGAMLAEARGRAGEDTGRRREPRDLAMHGQPAARHVRIRDLEDGLPGGDRTVVKQAGRVLDRADRHPCCVEMRQCFGQAPLGDEAGDDCVQRLYVPQPVRAAAEEPVDLGENHQ
jgi:hypothetical protein